MTLVLRDSDEDALQVVEELGYLPADAENYWVLDDVSLFLCRDRTSGELACNLRGSEEATVSERFDELAARLDAYSTDELLFGIEPAQSAAEVVQALFRLGLGAPPEFDERTATQLVGGLSFEHPMIRAAAIRSIAYLRWADVLLPLVERVADEDPDERVRQRAAELVYAVGQRTS
ncbi:HEAT repeat domain-containing protein [Kribbella sp. NPDC004536]|uniref:HEAT repeat domain-containing protein n=1 Tax=Kribbella sp. NPDC004536 TaxID=3364106 RepID=UPI0036C2302A